MIGEKECHDAWQGPSSCGVAEQNDLMTGNDDYGCAGAVTVNEHQQCEGRPELKGREEEEEGEPAATETDVSHTCDGTTLAVPAVPGTTRPSDGPRTLTSCQARNDVRLQTPSLAENSSLGGSDVHSYSGKRKGCSGRNQQRKISSFFLKGATSERVSSPVTGSDKCSSGYCKINSKGCFKLSVGSKWKSQEGDGKENGKKLSREEEEAGKRTNKAREVFQNDAEQSNTKNWPDWQEDKGKKWKTKHNNVFEILKLHSKSPAIRRTGITELAPNRVYREQYFIDAGQSDFTCTTCDVCGLVYARGVEKDEKVHARVHRRHLEGIRFEGWQQERVVKTFENEGGRIIEVKAEDPQMRSSKVCNSL
ncbi:hypothetical protein CBR_g51231 [Chara braunii]|uniref:N-acetyltransferase ESCO zinc-finger domain-containing protein n=1 Tax=Chara braunii TaxID=69332 RepID=A0A388M8A5_CHABU|nr:hypothetical protein CBR_g51231 [Chara braunii]|eukprot:GBG90723.1 hypothetical protein CBR_g51231 [Chara braunii]